MACALLATALLAAPALAEAITNGDFESGNTGFSSGYLYQASNTVAGAYGVGTDPNVWNWGLASHGDHTTGAGNMLLVNGASTLAVWSQTVVVQPNTTYEFSGWVVSTHPTSPATLRLFVDGLHVGSDIAVPPNPGVWVPGTWLRFSATWTSGAGTSAVLRISDLNPAPGGNDFALDDLSFRAPSAVPEPFTLALFGLGAIGVAWRKRRES